MKIIYTCPKCGHDLVDVSLCSYPAKNAMYCMNCGFMSEPESEEIVRIPYGGNYHYDHIINSSNEELLRINSSGNVITNSNYDLNFTNSDHAINDSNGELSRLNSSGNAFANSNYDLNFTNSACANCSNNPKNGGSGICLCTLGGPKITY